MRTAYKRPTDDKREGCGGYIPHANGQSQDLRTRGRGQKKVIARDNPPRLRVFPCIPYKKGLALDNSSKVRQKYVIFTA